MTSFNTPISLKGSLDSDPLIWCDGHAGKAPGSGSVQVGKKLLCASCWKVHSGKANLKLRHSKGKDRE